MFKNINVLSKPTYKNQNSCPKNDNLLIDVKFVLRTFTNWFLIILLLNTMFRNGKSVAIEI